MTLEKRTLLRLWLTLTLSCTLAAAGRAQQPVSVSVVQLLANPEAYNGKLVAVVGFLKLEFEGNILYLHEEDYRNAILANGIWIDIDKAIIADQEKLDARYVSIVGTFTLSKRGNYFGPGSITSLKSCTLWSDPRHPRSDRIREFLKQAPTH